MMNPFKCSACSQSHWRFLRSTDFLGTNSLMALSRCKYSRSVEYKTFRTNELTITDIEALLASF